MQISQPPMVQIGNFQCLSHRAFPEFFKTHPTLIYRSIVQASTSLQTNRQCYLIAIRNQKILYLMGTEIFPFGPLRAEKFAFKNYTLNFWHTEIIANLLQFYLQVVS